MTDHHCCRRAAARATPPRQRRTVRCSACTPTTHRRTVLASSVSWRRRAWCQSARSRTGAGRSSTCGAAASPASAPRCPADDHGRCNVNELGARSTPSSQCARSRGAAHLTKAHEAESSSASINIASREPSTAPCAFRRRCAPVSKSAAAATAAAEAASAETAAAATAAAARAGGARATDCARGADCEGECAAHADTR